MLVNGKEYDVDSLMKTIDTESNSLKKVGNLMLTNKEIDILKRNFIEFETCSSLKDLMIRIQAVLEDCGDEDDEMEELDYVLEKISERDYYEYKN